MRDSFRRFFAALFTGSLFLWLAVWSLIAKLAGEWAAVIGWLPFFVLPPAVLILGWFKVWGNEE